MVNLRHDTKCSIPHAKNVQNLNATIILIFLRFSILLSKQLRCTFRSIHGQRVFMLLNRKIFLCVNMQEDSVRHASAFIQ